MTVALINYHTCTIKILNVATYVYVQLVQTYVVNYEKIQNIITCMKSQPNIRTY